LERIAGERDFKSDEKFKAQILLKKSKGESLIFAKPETFMNRSGQAVGHFIKSKDGLSRLIVAHDDVDLPLGVIKMSVGRGSGGHKGVESVFRSVKSKEFTRLRIGISPITASGKIKKAGGKPVEEFVIADFKLAELAELKKIFKKGILKIEEIIK